MWAIVMPCGLLTANGRIGSELSRRLGLAGADFRALSRVWRHSGVSVRRKVAVYRACVESTLMYGLETAILNVADRLRLDGFQAKCLRNCLGISPSYVSQISNAFVRRKVAAAPLSKVLLLHQMRLFGKAAIAEPGTPSRDCTFDDVGVARPRTAGPRGRGRPRQTWAKEVRAVALTVVGGSEGVLGNILLDARNGGQKWQAAISKVTIEGN